MILINIFDHNLVQDLMASPIEVEDLVEEAGSPPIVPLVKCNGKVGHIAWIASIDLIHNTEHNRLQML